MESQSSSFGRENKWFAMQVPMNHVLKNTSVFMNWISLKRSSYLPQHEIIQRCKDDPNVNPHAYQIV